MSRRTEKQRILKEIAAQTREMQTPLEKEEIAGKISEEIFRKIVDKYGLDDKYEADEWNGMISYLAAEGLF